jgi:hypothetical protein
LAQQSAITKTMAVIGVLTVSFLGYDYYSRRTYNALLEEQRARAEQYKEQLRSVLAERKTTGFRVLKIERPEPGSKAAPRYLLRVSQWNEKQEKVFSYDFPITGNKIYFEGVVVHFQPERIAAGQSNVHLLHRVFSDVVPPAEGVVLADQQIQAADRLARAEVPMLDEQQRLSAQRYVLRVVQDPDFAKSEGVRAVNGQAVCDYQELSESYVYTLVEKADGGYLVEKAPIP